MVVEVISYKLWTATEWPKNGALLNPRAQYLVPYCHSDSKLSYLCMTPQLKHHHTQSASVCMVLGATYSNRQTLKSDYSVRPKVAWWSTCLSCMPLEGLLTWCWLHHCIYHIARQFHDFIQNPSCPVWEKTIHRVNVLQNWSNCENREHQTSRNVRTIQCAFETVRLWDSAPLRQCTFE